MTPEDDLARRALDLFEEVLDWPEAAAERDARLEVACAGEPGLLAAVRTLMAHDEKATRLIPTTPPPPPQPGRATTPPERIARWRLCELLGTGGMGSVYRAERADGVFEQTVAIKLLRPGLLSASAEARFADERRMLARLRHPNIAQLYDGGTDPQSGHAWLAMEYVVGDHITAYVFRKKLSLAQRLKLFIATCDAVQCAHQNLVVHADIKASNILVTHGSEPKLLDFGIAQWLSSDGNHPVSPHENAFTPGYAAPERLNGGAPTPAADIYSLGVLLADLLRVEEEMDVDADLQAILDKALARDPAERYPTAVALVDDIQRYLGRFPVLARPQTWSYVAGRFVRRHTIGVVLGALAAGTLVTATIIMSTLYVRAEHARAQADQRFQDIRQLSRFMIFDLYDEFARVPGTTTGRHMLVTKAQQYLDRLSSESSAPLDLRLETQVGKARLATVLGVPGNPNLGEVVAARKNLDAISTALETLLAQNPHRSDIKIELAFAVLQRAAIEIWNDHRAAAARVRLARARTLLADAGNGARALEVRQLLYWREADVDDWMEDVPALQKVTHTALQELAAWPPDLRAGETYAVIMPRMLMKSGDGFYFSGDITGALERYREADRLLRDAMERWPDRPALLSQSELAVWSIATTLSQLGRNDEAVVAFETAIALLDRMRAFDRNDIALLYQSFVARSAQADALSLVGRHDEAIAKLNTLVRERKARREIAPEDASAARGVAYELFMLGSVLERAGRSADACRAFSEAADGFTALDRAGHLTAWDRKEHLDEARKHSRACVPRFPSS